MRDPEILESATKSYGGWPTRPILSVPAIECFVGLNSVAFGDLVSDYDDSRLRFEYGLLDGQFGSFFSSFRPHVRATLRLTA